MLKSVISKAPAQESLEVFVATGDFEDWEDTLKHYGRRLTTMSRTELEIQYGVTAGPLMIIQNAEGEVEYRGGYGPRAYLRPDEMQDSKILARLQAGESPNQFPAFGCKL